MRPGCSRISPRSYPEIVVGARDHLRETVTLSHPQAALKVTRAFNSSLPLTAAANPLAELEGTTGPTGPPCPERPANTGRRAGVFRARLIGAI
jgi:hypothetical protein